MVQTRHNPECPMYQSSTRAASFGIRGAGGFSISPNLQVHPHVAPSSPSFDLLTKYLDSDCSTSLPKFKKSLEELFQKGEASPRDTLPNGETLLHVATKSMLRHCSNGSSHSANWHGLISGLIWMGVEGNSVCLSGRTPVDQLISFAAGLDGVDGNIQKLFKDIIICLCSYGSFISTGAFEITHFTGIYESGATNPPIVEYIQSLAREGLSDAYSTLRKTLDVYVPDELLPLIHRSTADLHQKLGASFNIKTAVDFYITWPVGLSILLNSGVIPSQSAFHFTCSNGYEDSVNLLIDTNALPINAKILQDVSLGPNEQVRDAITQAFILRRRHLQALVESHLTEKEMMHLRIRPGCLPGYNAGKAYQLLKAKSIDCLYPEDKSSWLLYENIGENWELADKLWDSGFRDVEEVDNNGGHPLRFAPDSHLGQFESRMQKVVWFIRNGYSCSVEPRLPSPILEFMWMFLPTIQHDLHDHGSGELRSGIAKHKEVLQVMLFDQKRDTCRCFCSSNGCNNFVRVLFCLLNLQRHTDDIIENSELAEKGKEFLGALQEIVHLLDPDDQSHIYDDLAPVLIRCLTFHTLGLTHTCDCLRAEEEEEEFEIPTDDDIEQTQREELDQLLQLDELVDEFQCTYNGLNQELPDFIEGYWCFRMQEVLSGVPHGLTPEEIQNIRGLGVILHEI
ncbi:hypothetical protein N7540_009335 [Penicillium herquei]|nr:hypothetical protein N7540_009335 [Penicillium herquei]